LCSCNTSSGGKGPQVVHGRAEQGVAEVEEAGPERGRIRWRVEPRCVGESLQRADEHGQLQIGGSDAGRAGLHPGPREDCLPLDELAGARTGVPGAAFGLIGLELEEVTAEWDVEPGERGLDAVGGVPECSLPPARRRRLGLSPPPALEQPAERQRSGLARTELADQTPCRQLARRVPDQDVGPVSDACAPRGGCLGFLTALRGARLCRAGAERGQGRETSNFDHHRENHRPSARSVVDQLPDGVVQVLLQQLDLGDVVGRHVRQHAGGLVSELVDQVL
jgi:hypothetical protein